MGWHRWQMLVEVRMQHVQGAIIAGAIFEIIIGISGLVGKNSSDSLVPLQSLQPSR